MRPLIAGNWKMNGLRAALEQSRTVATRLTDEQPPCDVLIAPPATLVAEMAGIARTTPLAIGGQDCHAGASGAHTGDISAEMLRDAGASACIVGHSERRSDHGETSAVVAAKASAVHRAGLTAIVCAGETAGERRAGLTLGVVARQLLASLPADASAANTVIAYEPVWAIGTGLTATVDDVATVHGAIRALLVDRFGDEGRGMRILYGGSVKPQNAAELLAVTDVNGALVGGASLKADDFLAIVDACRLR
ncbi:MAG: triose-phosphate isomerase [Hyphomicrobiaceae bacterium]